MNSPVVKKAALRGVRRARWARAQAFAAAGSDRYSAPATDGIDRRLLSIIGPNGFFVEAGANDGFRSSNTYLLERHHGWTGLLVEPIPHLYAACAARRRARTVQAALVSDSYADSTIEIHYADLLSAIGGSGQDSNWGLEEAYDLHVPARTLTSLLEEMTAPAPDLLSLDVELYEPEALAGLDFDRYAPRWMLLESHDQSTERFGAVVADRYETFEWITRKDVLLRLRD